MLNVALLILMMGCRDNKIAEDTGSEEGNWWGSEDETKTEEGSKDSSEDASEDKEIGDWEECSEDFDPQSPCEGSWEETICTYEGKTWWCDNGVWLNEDDKE